MAINKVEYGNLTLIDITDTTAESGDVINGQVFYAKNGVRSVGSLGDATTSTHGLMSAADKSKLDSINLDQKADVILNTLTSQELAYIPDGMKNYILTDYTIDIVPKEIVTGEPSPTNISTIKGINEINIYQTLKNIAYINNEITGVNINTGADTTIKRTNLQPGAFYIGVSKNNEWLGESSNRQIDAIMDNGISFISNNINYGMGLCCLVKNNTTYTLTYEDPYDSITISIAEYEEDGTFILGMDLDETELKTFTTHPYSKYILIIFRPTSDYINEYIYTMNVQLEYGTKATSYTLGTPTIIYSKSFGSNIGTVYYGTIQSLDDHLLNSSVNVVNTLNNFTVISTNTNTIHYRCDNFFSTYMFTSHFLGLCNIAKFETGEADKIHFNLGTNVITKLLDIWLPINTPLNTSILCICQKSWTAFDFIPPNNITLYKGENYFYTDSGTMTINYAADTKSYIDDHINNILMPAEVEVIRL